MWRKSTKAVTKPSLDISSLGLNFIARQERQYWTILKTNKQQYKNFLKILPSTISAFWNDVIGQCTVCNLRR